MTALALLRGRRGHAGPSRPLRAADWVFPVLTVCLTAVVVLSMMTGAVAVPAGAVVQVLFGWTGWWDATPLDVTTVTVLEVIRLPRVGMAVLIGATLAVMGAVMQALFRNPLADPGLIGVSSGAAVAATAAIVLGGMLPAWVMVYLPAGWLLPLAAFSGGLLVTAMIYALSSSEGRPSMPMMLLTGIALNAVGGAVVGFLVYLADDQQLRQLTFWTMGGLGALVPGTLMPATILMAVAVLGALWTARSLNLLLLGEAEAWHLGVRVDALKRVCVVLVALGVGAGVAVAGTIAFVGLVGPHLVRLMTGPDHRLVLPGSACMGAILLTVSDLLARTLAVPAEMPVGLIMAGVGGPFFLILLLRLRRKGGL